MSTLPSQVRPGQNWLGRFNAMTDADAAAVLLTACGSAKWARAVVAGRPYPGSAELFQAADRCWWQLAPADWLEAFSHHPCIGERDLSQPKFAATAEQSSREQSGMAAATEDQRARFHAGNQKYLQRFGHVFLVCATGKTASEMLQQLETRLGNDAATELRNAAGEQSRITRLRLERLVSA